MRISRLVTGIIVLLAAVSARQIRGEAVQDQPKTIGRIVGADARLNQLVAPGTPFEVIGSGYDWSEGPLWVPREGGFLLFSDIPPNSIMKWKPGAGVSLFMKPS